jgi:2-methylaconitate cis-trans-isomerase PrpF
MVKNKKISSSDLQRSFESTLLIMNSPLWGAYLPVPEEVATFYKEKSVTRFIAQINDRLTLHCAIMPGGNQTFFILMNKTNVKALKIEFGMPVEVILSPDNSKYGMPLGEELEALLQEDAPFAQSFEKLTPGKQRNLIYLINKAKSSEIRLRTAIVVAAHLEANNGHLDFKMLNEALKQK